MVRFAICLPIFAFVLAVSPLAADDPKAADEPKKEKAFQMTDEEKQVLEMTNAERAKKDLPPLKANPTLIKVARLHSANMAKQGIMSHFLDGKSPAQRATAGGYDWTRIAENVANSDGAPLKDIMEGWMNSKIHRENILRTGLEEIGIGIARNDKEVYYTQLFATPRRKQ
jgi:uncharacterized protein YkwD